MKKKRSSKSTSYFMLKMILYLLFLNEFQLKFNNFTSYYFLNSSMLRFAPSKMIKEIENGSYGKLNYWIIERVW